MYKPMFTNGFVLGIVFLTYTLIEAWRSYENEKLPLTNHLFGLLNDVVRLERDYDQSHEQEPKQEHGHG